MGDISDATAIPNARGKATKDTLIAAKRSLRQFSFSPLSPSRGIKLLVFIDQIKDKYGLSLMDHQVTKIQITQSLAFVKLFFICIQAEMIQWRMMSGSFTFVKR
jgi:hypothetical protein